MLKVKVDTTEIKSCGSDMMKLALDLGEQIDGLFDKLTNIQSTVWTGKSAEEFVRKVTLEKNQYVKFKEQLYNEGKFLYTSALKFEYKLNTLKR